MNHSNLPHNAKFVLPETPISDHEFNSFRKVEKKVRLEFIKRRNANNELCMIPDTFPPEAIIRCLQKQISAYQDIGRVLEAKYKGNPKRQKFAKISCCFNINDRMNKIDRLLEVMRSEHHPTLVT